MESTETIVMTGVTGYVGSALAARLLRGGARVIALARGESANERVRAAVAAAAAGFGSPLTEEQLDLVRVFPTDLETLASERGAELARVTSAWHCAAEMSFAAPRLEGAFRFNVGWTLGLYDLLAKAGGCQRFYYVSTAFVGGFGAARIPEELHLSPWLNNPYVVTKWGAEMALEKASRAGMPVTVVRPTVVVGHAGTCWYGGKSFGPYNFVDAMRIAKSLGANTVAFDIDPTIAHNYVPIDDLVENAVALVDRHEQQRRFEIVHCLGTEMSNRERMDLIADVMGMHVRFGAPETPHERTADAYVAVNKPFNRAPHVVGRFPFEAESLARILDGGVRSTPLDRTRFRALCEWYVRNVAAPTLQRDSRQS